VYSVEGRLAIEKRNYSSADLWSHIATRFDGPQTHYDDNDQRVSNVWFQVTRYSSFNQYVVPYWFCVIIPAAIAVAPWFRCRFSLRTLLITMMLIAVVLGLIVWLSKE
jgi:hypothetical protein